MPKASLTPAEGSGKCAWLNRFSRLLPHFAAQTGFTATRAAQLAAQFHAKSIKPKNKPPTP